MDKYTLLLVDDEEEVIQIILKKIDWEELGFSVIGYANNGVNALEMVEEFQPDVVMTDIKMPYMDGMELSRRIKSQFPATKLLLLTGFDDFEYVKEALHLKVEEYILKPVNAVELAKVLTKLKGKLDEEINEKRNIETLQKYYMESLPFLRANFYGTLLEGNISEQEMGKYLDEYQIHFEGPFYCCLVVRTSSRQIPEGMNFQLLSTSVRNLAKERLSERWNAKCFNYLENTILIVQLGDENEVSELTDDCERFCRYANRIAGAFVTVGIGQVCDDILKISQSYRGAKEAVSYRALLGSSRAINIREIAPQIAEKPENSGEAELLNLFKVIKLGAKEDILEAVEKYLNHVLLQAKSLQQHNIELMELLSALYRFAANNDIELKDLDGDMGGLYGYLLETDPDSLRTWLLDTCISLGTEIESARYRTSHSLVARAKEYVYNHYADEMLALDDICEVLGVSNSYFSTIFKKETGTSFIGYLTDYRMEKASRLLIETNEKSYMIAKNVGYADPNYFSYVFKRHFGVSPSKYRTEYAESER